MRLEHVRDHFDDELFLDQSVSNAVEGRIGHDNEMWEDISSSYHEYTEELWDSECPAGIASDMEIATYQFTAV